MIYLDNAATTKIHPDVLQEMMPYLQEEYGNAGTLYSLGTRARDAVELARQRVATYIGAKPEQIVFTSSGSEANNMVFYGVKKYLEQIGKKHVAISMVEHDSVYECATNLYAPSVKNGEKTNIKDDFYTHYIPVERNCMLDMDKFLEILEDENIGLVSVMYSNNETGVVNPVHHVGKICRERGILFHTDCVQAAGFYGIKVDDLQCDFLTISGHKIHAPKGVGALYVRNKEIFNPMIYGGKSQEFGLRGGTQNVAGIVGLGKACEIATIGFKIYSMDMKMHFYDTLVKSLNHKKIIDINGDHLRGKVLNIRIKNVDAETLLMMLNERGVCISAGSACRSHEAVPSRVLLAMGKTPDEAMESVRISFSAMNTLDEIHEAAEIVAECVNTLYEISGAGE